MSIMSGEPQASSQELTGAHFLSILLFVPGNKIYDPIVVKFFHLRVLLDIVRQGEKRLQLGRFREFVEEFSGYGGVTDGLKFAV